MKKSLFLILSFSFVLSCEGVEVSIDNQIDSSFFVGDLPVVTSNEVLNRAYQLATLEWTPVDKIPYREGLYYMPGKKVKGVPYSSVKEINTYLFQDVSYYTFMTAVHNPESVLYTEDISAPPYHGLNCAPYYGAVCSSSVMYALGIDIPYYVKQIPDLPFMKKLEHQVIDSLKVCDLILMSGHVQMIFDIEYQDDKLNQVLIFESSGMSAHIYSCSRNQFLKAWNDHNYVGYRYTNLQYLNEPTEFMSFEPISYNDDLCPSKGDKAVYRTDDTIIIDIFNSNYHEIVLQKDDSVLLSDTYESDTYSFSDLDPGIYICYLQSGDIRSNSVSFEVIMTDVSVSFTHKDNVLVRFQSNVTADYVAICDEHGSSDYYPISEEMRQKGFIVVPLKRHSVFYCKVIFKGEYGRITNHPIRME